MKKALIMLSVFGLLFATSYDVSANRKGHKACCKSKSCCKKGKGSCHKESDKKETK